MTAGRFASSQALASRLIAQYGEVATLTRKTDGAPPDADKPWEPGAPTYASHQVSAVWLANKRERDELTRAEGYETVLVSAADLSIVPDPTTDHIHRADGTAFELVQVEALAPNEDRIVYRLTVRR